MLFHLCIQQVHQAVRIQEIDRGHVQSVWAALDKIADESISKSEIIRNPLRARKRARVQMQNEYTGIQLVVVVHVRYLQSRSDCLCEQNVCHTIGTPTQSPRSFTVRSAKKRRDAVSYQLGLSNTVSTKHTRCETCVVASQLRSPSQTIRRKATVVLTRNSLQPEQVPSRILSETNTLRGWPLRQPDGRPEGTG